MRSPDPLRDHLARSLAWGEAHADIQAVLAGIGAAHRGVAPPGLPHSPWQLLEHLRLAQGDILEFCVNPAYTDKAWPDEYWPTSAAPPTDSAWDESVASYLRDRDALQRLARDPAVDLFARIPHGTGQTYLREILLVIDHAAYHTGQMVLVCRLLGIWPAA